MEIADNEICLQITPTIKKNWKTNATAPCCAAKCKPVLNMSDDQKRSAPSSDDVDSQHMEDDQKSSVSDVDSQDMGDDRKPRVSASHVDSQENSTVVIPVISYEEPSSRVCTLTELNGELLLSLEFLSGDSIHVVVAWV